MVGQDEQALVALRARRERVIDSLSTQFANDALEMDEFERRVDLAHRATSVAELDRLLTDLEPQASEETVESPVPLEGPGQVARATDVPASKTMLSVLANIEREGSWRVPTKLRVIAVLGAVDLDFREAQLGPGVTEVQVIGVLGGIDITVPPELRVECDGVAIAGTFEALDRTSGERAPDEPLLRITGVSLFSSVEASILPSDERKKISAPHPPARRPNVKSQ